jgi:hypothetical protein
MSELASGTRVAARLRALEPEVGPAFEGADYVDVVSVEGGVSLRTFIAGMLSYYPWWLGVLFALRWAFVRLLGLSQTGLLRPSPTTPVSVPFEPGGRLGLFSVVRAEPDRYWIGRISEPHLTATIAVVADTDSARRRFHVATAVDYADWRGRCYFAIVRPFHALVVRRMANAGTLPERRIGSAVVNVHERLFDAESEQLWALVDSLGTAEDQLWPGDRWPEIRFDGPLQPGTRGSHGAIRYVVEESVPGERVQFRFVAPDGYVGSHRFELQSAASGGTWLRHVVEVRLHGRARLSWPLTVRWLHDAVLEDALDNASVAMDAVPQSRQWSRRVRLLRRLS